MAPHRQKTVGIPYRPQKDTEHFKTQFSTSEKARWERAFKRMMRDLAAMVKVYSKAEIAALYPGGYPEDRLAKADQTTGAYGERKKRRGRPKQYNNQGF
jgi:hypothetical protein